ncbi:hypothetical protein [Halohasta litorea]|uniref:Ig-like domain-containing protein n=1 Tax=Halohasta litorea TaxID=869891 RepID=A0ABD6D5J0_9EURY|nr:hypothetical protein [Halohasta litorea]
MRVDRRRVVIGSLSLLVSAGCLGESSLSTPFDLRIENRSNRPRELSVVVDRVREEPLYDETLEIPPGERITEPAVVETAGRYRIGVTDLTTDEERTAEQYVELSMGRGFCGWFVVRAAHESVAVSVPRCPNEEANGSAENATDEP